jgi:hypothetical protein
MVGREQETRGITFLLDQAKNDQLSGFKLIEGAYGSGKSMMLSCLENYAIDEGFVVARFTLGSHNNFSKPEILYKDIMSHLKTVKGDAFQPFEDIFDKWLKKEKSVNDDVAASKAIFHVIKEMQNFHPAFANVLLSYIRSLINSDFEQSSIALGWIRGDMNLAYEQKKKIGIKGQVDKYNALDILKGVSNLFVLLGFSGLVILVDELEIIMRERKDIREKAYTAIRQTIDEIGENHFSQLVFVGAHTPDMMENNQKGYKSYEALYGRISKGFEIKGLPMNSKYETIICLSDLKDEDLIAIGSKILQLKNLDINKEYLSKLSLMEYKTRISTEDRKYYVRDFIKTHIQMIELYMEHPEIPIFQANR